MSHLNDIVEAVKTKGRCEVPLLSLYNLYFRGNDWREKMKAWATQNNLNCAVTPPDYYAVPDSQRSVRFYSGTATGFHKPR